MARTKKIDVTKLREETVKKVESKEVLKEKSETAKMGILTVVK